MRYQATITRWDDAKGFGFIRWHGDGSSVFFHISDYPKQFLRPVVEDIVSYELVTDDGRHRAKKVRPAGRQKPVKPAQSRPSLITALLLVLLCFLLVSAYLQRISWLVVIAYPALSLMTFFAYGWDKSSARHGKWRTAESTLHLLALCGGWPGALAAQHYFRHKTRKHKFLITFWITVFVNVLMLGYLVGSDQAGFVAHLLARLP